MIVKTLDDCFDRIKDVIEKMHSYDVPCIEAIKAKDVNKSYLKWVFGEVTAKKK